DPLNFIDQVDVGELAVACDEFAVALQAARNRAAAEGQSEVDLAVERSFDGTLAVNFDVVEQTPYLGDQRVRRAVDSHDQTHRTIDLGVARRKSKDRKDLKNRFGIDLVRGEIEIDPRR